MLLLIQGRTRKAHILLRLETLPRRIPPRDSRPICMYFYVYEYAVGTLKASS